MWTEPVGGDPRPVEIGIATGRGLMVVDLDDKNRKQGSLAFEALEAEHGHVPRSRVVITPSGGRHIYLRTPLDSHVANSSNRLGPGIDIRGEGGYVVAVGTFGTGSYRPAVLGEPGAPVAWLLEKTHGSRPDVRRADVIVGEIDTRSSIEAATAWLLEHAPASGSYNVACRLVDWALAPETAAGLMVDHLNPRRDRPREYEHFLFRCENAWKYRHNPVGSATADEFDDVSDAVPTTVPPRAETVATDPIWIEPEDLWTDTGPLPDLGHGILPDVIEAWCRDEAVRKGASVGAVAVPALVMLASALDARFQVQVKQNDYQHTEHAILWGALVGGPGARKTPVLREIMKPIAEIEREWSAQHERAMAAYNGQVARAKRDKEGPPPPPKPILRTKTINDTTTESVVIVEAENPTGLLLFMDELAGWAGGMDSYRAGKGAASRDAAFWLQAKNGGRYAVRRVSRDAVSAEVHAVNVLGGIQPDVIRRLAADWGGNGLMQRFLISHLGNAGAVPDRPPDAAIRAHVDAAVRRLIGLRPTDFTNPFRFEPAADEFRRRIVEISAASSSNPVVPTPLQGWFSKLEGEWARIALVMHAAEWATDPDAVFTDSPDETITAATAERAFRFLVEYQIPQQTRFYFETVDLGAPSASAAQAVAGHILAHGLLKLTDRDLQQRFRSRLSGPERFNLRQATMNALDLAGWVTVDDQRNGRPHKWTVNPAVHDGRFQARAETELSIRTERRAQIAIDGAARAATKG